MERKIHKIDATDKVLGRLATQIAVLLMGKNKASFVKHIDQGDIVEVSNVERLRFTGKKLDQKVYYRHSHYPGGLREEKLRMKFSQKPQEVLRLAVYNMLPVNRLRAERIKRIKFV